MNYRINYAGTEGVRLKQIADIMIVPFIGTFLSGILLCVGLGMVIHDTANYTGWTFLCAVPLFALMPWFIAGKSQRLSPQEIVFDNNNAFIVFIQNSRLSRTKAYLAYQEIAVLDYVEVVSLSSGNNTLPNRSYVVRFVKHDGIQWGLATFSSEKKAQEMLATLLAHVHLQKHCRSLPLESLPQGINIEQTHAQTTYSWQSKASIAIIALVFLFFTTFFGLLYLLSRSADFGVALWIIGGTGVFIAIAFFVGLIRGAGSSQSIRITAENIELITNKRNGGEQKHETLLLDDIVAVGFDFGGNDLQTTLRFLTKQYRESVQHLQQGGQSIGEIWQSLKNSFRLPSIEIGLMPVAERLTIEHHLNREILRRRNAEVLYAAHTQGMHWWENTQGATSETMARLSNRTVGMITLLMSPLPLFSIAALLLPNDIHLVSTIYKSYMTIECLRLIASFYAGYRLWTRTHRKLSGALLMLLPCCAVAFALSNSVSYALWCVFLLIIVMVIGGISLLSAPDED